MCMEKRVFYRVVSGLHAAINVHVASHYPRAALFGEETWGPNTTLFERFFHPDKTFGEGERRRHRVRACDVQNCSAVLLFVNFCFSFRPKLVEECLLYLLAGKKKRGKSNPFESVMKQGNAFISAPPFPSSCAPSPRLHPCGSQLGFTPKRQTKMPKSPLLSRSSSPLRRGALLRARV
jgi:hypothetical protein